MDSAVIIESSNFLWLIVAAFGAYSVIKWRWGNHLTEHTTDAVRAWCWVFLASGINHGWFAASRHFSADDERWNLAMYDYRWVVVLGTSLMFSWGMLSFIRHIEGFGYMKKFALFMCAFAVAFGLGFY